MLGGERGPHRVEHGGDEDVDLGPYRGGCHGLQVLEARHAGEIGAAAAVEWTRSGGGMEWDPVCI